MAVTSELVDHLHRNLSLSPQHKAYEALVERLMKNRPIDVPVILPQSEDNSLRIDHGKA